MKVIKRNEKIEKFIKDHRKELIIGGVIVGGAVCAYAGVKLYQSGFAKGAASMTYANGANCNLKIAPRMWDNGDGTKILTAALTHVGPSETGSMISSTMALDSKMAAEVVTEFLHIFGGTNNG